MIPQGLLEERDPTAAAPNTQTRKRTDVPGRIILCLVLAAVYPRLYFGLAFFDEAYYLALPYSFSLGYRPFLDENAIHQLAGLLIQPFVEVYLAATGSHTGLVLFGRHLYLAGALLAAWIVRGFWLRTRGERVANLLAAVVIAYVPFCIFGLSYNSLTYLGLLAATALLASACLSGNPPLHLFFATLLLAGVAFAYPPMLPIAGLALALGLVAVLRTCRPEQRTAAVAWTAAAAVGSAAVGGGYLLASNLPEAIDQIVGFSRAQGVQGGGAAKWKALQAEISFQGRFLVLLSLALLVPILGVARAPNPKLAACAAMLLWPALAYASTYYREFHAPFTTVPYVLSLLGLAAPVLVFVSRERLPRQQWIGLLVVTSTSIAAGLGILWSTANGLRNAALGLTPAAIVALACLTPRKPPSSRAIDRGGDGLAFLRDPNLPFTVFVSSLLLFQVLQLWTHAYREFVPSELGPRVEHGAWKGIKTTASKIDFMTELRGDLARVRGNAETIIFFDYFPAGYLMSDLVPRTPGLWLFPVSRIFQGNAGLRKVYADRLRSRRDLPDLVVRMRCIPARPLTKMKLLKGDPLSALFNRADYENVVERECYRVAKRRPSRGPLP